MKKYLALLCFGLLPFAPKAQKTSFEDKAKAYIEQYAAWAIEEQQRVGIPASITLAQGIYETGAGESELATQANNHFGIKCKKEWKGETFAHTDDAPNECFRKYASAKESYVDHSNYLVTSKRYAELFTYEQTDYKAWSKGLKRCGYATNPAYAHKLIKMVEDFDLQQYTLAASRTRQNEIVPTKDIVKETIAPKQDMVVKEGLVTYNDLKAIYCRRGDNLLELAMKQNIRYAKLLEINELQDEPLQRDMYLYLEPKRNKGTHASYVVQEGETVELIAHKEGMNSRQLRIFNLMAQNEEPAAGEILLLQAQADDRPKTYKMTKEERKANAQNIRLIDANRPIKNDDFIATKKAVQSEEKVATGFGVKRELLSETETMPTKQKTEEVEMGYGAEAPAFLKNKKMESPNAPAIQANQPQQVEANFEVKEVVEEQSQEPLDEFELLKQKLDKAVYSKTSKSNIKVSSTDAAAIRPSESTTIATKTQANIPESNAVFHTVAKGETAYGIAKKYSISVKKLNELNSLDFEGIKVGQKLRVK